MGIKETPTNFRVYCTTIKERYAKLREDYNASLNALLQTIKELRLDVEDNISVYKEQFNVNLNDYEEYRTNTYIDGSFLKIAKELFINRKDNYNIVADLFTLYNYATKQKEAKIIQDNIAKCDKIINIKLNDYCELLRKFYTEVHRQMILNGYGYVFEGHIGWTCINRVKIIGRGSCIDYAATKKNKAKLREAGVRIYNKEEAQWCKENGFEYNGVDGRVFLTNEYAYEIPLIGCTLPNGYKYRLEISNYRGREIRKFTNDKIREIAKDDINTICDYPLDIRAKLNLCDEIDKKLYLNFIRNENQTSVAASKANRKN